jgi:spore coat protein U-like protein
MTSFYFLLRLTRIRLWGWARPRPDLVLVQVLVVMLALSTQPALANGNNCLFQSKGMSLNFGNLNPSSNLNVSVPAVAASLNADRAGDCAGGQAMAISGDQGLHAAGTRRLKHATSNDYIAYTLTFPPSQPRPGNNSYVPFVIVGTVQSSAYASARVGNYADSVVIFVNP